MLGARQLKTRVRDVAAGLLYAAGVTRPARAAAAHVVIATFHRVLPREHIAVYPSPEIAVTPDELSWFLDLFGAHFRCGTLSETMALFTDSVPGREGPRPLLAITFDDGHGDNFHLARPVLAAHEMHATFFVVPGAIDAGVAGARQLLWPDRLGYALHAIAAHAPGTAEALFSELAAPAAGERAARVNAAIQNAKRWPTAKLGELLDRCDKLAGGAHIPPWEGLMSWDQVRTLASDGHEIGSHSLSHPIMPLCDDAQLARETTESRARIAAELGRDVASFCYPNGSFDDRVVESVKRAGYRWAVTTRFGQVERGSATSAPLRLHRCDIQSATARNTSGRLSAARMALRLSRFHRSGDDAHQA